MKKPQQAFNEEPGKYYVRYKDDTNSMCMSKRTAKVYAELNGGRVYRHSYFPTIGERFSNTSNRVKLCGSLICGYLIYVMVELCKLVIG